MSDGYGARNRRSSLSPTDTASDPHELQGGHVFRMWLVDDVFRKLHRERRRFEQAGSDNDGRHDQVDAALNFAITAWHMTDWVWERKEQYPSEYFEEDSEHDFLNKIRVECPDLGICDVIANAAKHGGVAKQKDYRPKEVETVLVGKPISNGGSGVELYAVEVDREWSLKIEVDGKAESVHAVLSRVFLFWHNFIQKRYRSE